MTQNNHLLKVGIVGTGYAASKRTEAFESDPRAKVVGVTSHTASRIADFSQKFSLTPYQTWEKLVTAPEIDLVAICTINRDRGKIVRGAIEAGKQVVVEYPLCLDPTEAAEIIALAKNKAQLLHVEHIELIGGLHQAMRQHLSAIGNVYYARYITLSGKHPAPQRWNYHRELFGFPLTAALSRLHRLTDLFGTVSTVSCQNRYWQEETEYFRACLCNAQLKFTNGLVADVTYGKGDVFYASERTFELHGDRGTLLFEGEKGTLIRGKEKIPLEVESRRGLFAKDTQMVLDCLLENKPLYVSPDDSLYALQVADAARRSSITGQTIKPIANASETNA